MKHSKSIRSPGKTVASIILWILLIVFVSPFVIVVINSLKSNAEIMSNPLKITSNPTFDNYVTAFNTMNYPSALLNTILISVVSVVLIIITSAMTAYFVARSHTKTGKVIFYFLVASMMIPFQAVMIPLVTIYGNLGLLNSRLTLIYLYVGFGCGMGMFIFHGFINSSIPLSLNETEIHDRRPATDFLLDCFSAFETCNSNACGTGCAVDLERLPASFAGLNAAVAADASSFHICILRPDVR